MHKSVSHLVGHVSLMGLNSWLGGNEISKIITSLKDEYNTNLYTVVKINLYKNEKLCS
jgi:hypothetical protein